MFKERRTERLAQLPMEGLVQKWLQLDDTGKKAPEKIAGLETTISELMEREASGLTSIERTSLHDARAHVFHWRTVIEENNTKLALVSTAIADRSDEFDALLLEREDQLLGIIDRIARGQTTEQIAPYQERYESLLRVKNTIFGLPVEDPSETSVSDVSPEDADATIDVVTSPTEKIGADEPPVIFGLLNSIDVEMMKKAFTAHDDFLARLLEPDKDPAETKMGSIFDFSREPLEEGETKISDPTARRKEALERVTEMIETGNIPELSDSELGDPVIKNALLLLRSFSDLAQRFDALQKGQSGMDILIGILTDPEVRRKGFVIDFADRQQRFFVYEGEEIQGDLRQRKVLAEELKTNLVTEPELEETEVVEEPKAEVVIVPQEVTVAIENPVEAVEEPQSDAVVVEKEATGTAAGVMPKEEKKPRAITPADIARLRPKNLTVRRPEKEQKLPVTQADIRERIAEILNSWDPTDRRQWIKPPDFERSILEELSLFKDQWDKRKERFMQRSGKTTLYSVSAMIAAQCIRSFFETGFKVTPEQRNEILLIAEQVYKESRENN